MQGDTAQRDESAPEPRPFYATPDQLDLDFHSPATDGYAVWQWDQEQAVRRIAEERQLPLGRTVRVKLWNLDQEFVGRLQLVRRPEGLNRKEPLSLSVGTMPFLSTEIESCAVVGNGKS